MDDIYTQAVPKYKVVEETFKNWALELLDKILVQVDM